MSFERCVVELIYIFSFAIMLEMSNKAVAIPVYDNGMHRQRLNARRGAL
jgi:hypothetical protein